jgi:hypothetical protein
MGRLSSISAIQIILDRATCSDHVEYFLEAMRSNDSSRQKDGIIALYTVLPNVKHQTVSRLKILKHVVRLLFKTTDENVATYGLMALYSLIKDNERKKAKCVGYKVIPHLVHMTKVNPHKCGSKIYWIIMLMYQFSLSETIVPTMIKDKVPLLLLSLAKRKYGAVSALKYCIHTLVRIISTVTDDEAAEILQDLYANGCIDVLSAALRNTDHELSSWAVFLLHEFALHGIFC